jgi:predicted nucleotidyltransferase
VNDLSAAGLVSAEPAGRAVMVALNRDHLAVEPLVEIVRSRTRLVDRLERELTTWPSLAGAWLFGSMARGDGGRESDVDLFLVGESPPDEDWVAHTARLLACVRSWTGNQAQLVEHTRKSLAQLIRRRNPIVTALRADGIPLTDGTRALLRGVV